MKFKGRSLLSLSCKPVVNVVLVILILGTFLSTFVYVPPIQNAKADGAGWYSTYAYRKQITIGDTNVGSNLSYFPVLVASSTDTNVGAGIIDTTHGYDVRFTDSNGSTLLPYERENFSVTSGSASFNFWVRVPTVTTAAPTVIYMYYGKAGDSATDWTAQTSTMTDCTSITNAQCAWKEGSAQNFSAVYHLKETGSGSTSDYKDSTANGNNAGQASNEPTHTDSGQVGGAQSFNGSSNYISTPNTVSIKPSLPITVSAFLKSGNVTAFSGILTNDNYFTGGVGNYYGIELDQSSAGKLRASFGDGLGGTSANRRTKTGTTGMSLNTWYHTAFVLQGATNMNLYLNGTDDGGAYTGTGGTMAYSSSQGRIAEMDSNLRWNGIIDELRMSAVVRSAQWLKFENCNMRISASGTCIGNNELAYAAQETPPAGFVVSEVTPVSTPTNNTTPSYTFNSTEAGTITYGGDCLSSTNEATVGNNTITFNTLSAGAHSNCTIYVTDASSNQSNILSITPFTIDLTAPTISSVTTTLVSGTYNAGQAIPITVNFSEAVTSSGNVTVTLNTTPSRNCTFTISNGTSGSCTYTVQSGDAATHLDTTISGTVTDQAGNPMSNFTPTSNLSASKTINIGDLTAPVDLTQPVPLIVDTDMNTDYDDPFALAIANALAQEGKAKLLAVVINVNSTYGAPTANVINAWWGHSTSTIPIGVYLGSLTGGGAYEQQITSTFGVSGDTKSNYPSALTVYRQTLANAADKSVVIDSIGTLTNLQALLQSPADGISPLTGMQLVTQKVRRLVVMGGEYPSGSEHNFAYSSYAASSASYVMANWPTEIVVDGYNFGVSVSSHPAASRDINTDPLAQIWDIMTSPGAGHSSWDPLNTLYSITGLSTNFTAAGISGINTVNSGTGANSWAGPGLGNVTYLGKAVSDAALGTTLNSIADTIPIIISSISSGTPSLTGATITWTTSGTNTVANGNWVSTNINTNSEINYGLTSSYGSSATDASAVSSHSVALSGLSPNTTYHYRVKSTYSDGSYAVSDDQTFTTAADTTPPVSFTPTADPASWTNGDVINISFSTTDADTGIANYKLKVDSGAYGGNITSPYAFDVSGLSGGEHTVTIKATDNASNIREQSVIIYLDRTAPVVSDGMPSGTLNASVTSASLSVATGEAATCRYSTIVSTAYGAMIDNFLTTGGTTHSTTVSGLSAGNSYTYYIRCQDNTGNSSTSDYPISFSIASPSSPAPTTTPTPSSTSESSNKTTQDKQTPQQTTPQTSELPTASTNETVIQKIERFFKTKILWFNNQKVVETVKFQIVDKDSKPISGLEVTIHSEPQTAETNENGVVTFSNVPVGKHTLVFNTDGSQFNKKVSVADPNAKEGTFQAEILTIKAEKDPTPIWVWIVISILSLTVLILGVRQFRKSRR